MDKENPLFRFVRSFVPEVEGGVGAKRYKATFSTGGSGMSFGAMQNDVRNNRAADDALNQILDEAVGRNEFDAAVRKRLDGFAHEDADERKRLQDLGEWMTADEESKLNAAPDHASSRSLIDTLDDTQADVLAKSVRDVMDQMHGRPYGAGVLAYENPDPATVGLLAAWHNRVGDLVRHENSWRARQVL